MAIAIVVVCIIYETKNSGKTVNMQESEVIDTVRIEIHDFHVPKDSLRIDKNGNSIEEK